MNVDDANLFNAIQYAAEHRLGIPVIRDVVRTDLKVPGLDNDGETYGYYNTQDHTVTVGMDSPRPVLALLHELAHAIDPEIPHHEPLHVTPAEVAELDLVAETVSHAVAILLGVEIDDYEMLLQHLVRHCVLGGRQEPAKRVGPIIVRLYRAIAQTDPDPGAIVEALEAQFNGVAALMQRTAA